MTTPADLIAWLRANPDPFGVQHLHSDEVKAWAEELDAWNAGIERAREAYAGQMSNEAGFCAECHERRRDGRHTRCWTCRHKSKRKN